MVLMQIWQEWNNQRENDQNDLKLTSERNQRDSLITVGVEKNRRELFEDISKAFAKQELKLDVVTKEISRIRDSTKIITNNFGQPDPVLLIRSNGIYFKTTADSMNIYTIRLTSFDAGSTNFDISCYILAQFIDGTYDFGKMNFPGGGQIPKNGICTTDLLPTKIKCNKIYVYLKGTYTTLDNIKTYKIDTVYEYDSNQNNVVIVSQNIKKELVEKMSHLSKDSNFFEK